jgi:hypothetical protein
MIVPETMKNERPRNYLNFLAGALQIDPPPPSPPLRMRRYKERDNAQLQMLKSETERERDKGEFERRWTILLKQIGESDKADTAPKAHSNEEIQKMKKTGFFKDKKLKKLNMRDLRNRKGSMVGLSESIQHNEAKTAAEKILELTTEIGATTLTELLQKVLAMEEYVSLVCFVAGDVLPWKGRKEDVGIAEKEGLCLMVPDAFV